MKIWQLTVFSMLFTPTLSFAFFCPTNFSQVNFGMTIDQVTQACGPPDKQETKDEKATGPQEWSYFVPQTVATSALNSTQGTLKTQVAFDGNGKVINLSVNGIGVGSSAICGQTIQLGDDVKKVKAVCGDPTMINKQDNAQSANQPTTSVTTMLYNANPPVKLIFENGKFVRKE